MSAPVIRAATAIDRDAIRRVEVDAFGGDAEARLVDALAAAGDVVLELVAERDGRIVGHVLFSRLNVMQGDGPAFSAVALAPLAVDPGEQSRGTGSRLVEDGHRRIRAMGEVLAVVVGDPAYYGRFGYERARVIGFDSDFQCDAMLALAWGEAPSTGRLVYATPFGDL